jgi:short-subunit dehydrogenase
MTGVRYTTAVVTGASRGLGFAIASVLCERGLNVVGVARSSPPPEAKFEWVEADIANYDDVCRVFSYAQDRYGEVDVLVNNAAGGWVQPFEETDPLELKGLVEVNLTGQIFCAREAVPGMLKARRGLIINIGSDWSKRYAPQASVYAATKFGLLGFSGSLLREVKDRGVKVVCVMPGGIDTSWGGLGEEGSHESWNAMPPGDLAEVIGGLLDLPEHMLLHELLIHPTGQGDF